LRRAPSRSNPDLPDFPEVVPLTNSYEKINKKYEAFFMKLCE